MILENRLPNPREEMRSSLDIWISNVVHDSNSKRKGAHRPP